MFIPAIVKNNIEIAQVLQHFFKNFYLVILKHTGYILEHTDVILEHTDVIFEHTDKIHLVFRCIVIWMRIPTH